MNKLKVENDVVQQFYGEVMEIFKINHKIEPLLEDKLILDLLSRKIAIYVFENNIFDDNDFKLVTVRLNNKVINISVGTIKKRENEEPTLVYGII